MTIVASRIDMKAPRITADSAARIPAIESGIGGSSGCGALARPVRPDDGPENVEDMVSRLSLRVV